MIASGFSALAARLLRRRYQAMPRRSGYGRRQPAARGARAHPRAKSLIVDVAGAELVAVQHDEPHPVDVDDLLLGQDRHAGRAREHIAEQEIAIAARHEHGDAGGAQRC
jgi:hypothetical protein